VARSRPMAWAPMSRETADAVLADQQLLAGVAPVEVGAREYEARLVIQGKPASEIYERLTDFLGHRPDAGEEEKT